MDNTLAMTLQPQSLEPTAEDVAMLTRQYQKALDGLFEAYQFGMMLRAVRIRLEEADAAAEAAAEPLQIAGSPCSLTRETARRIVGNNGNEMVCAGGWNRGMGLKGWLAIHCPEINYKTACRFLAVAEKTVAALALADEAEASEAAAVGSASPASPESWGEAPCASAGEGARSPFPPEAKVRAFLAGKSQRAVLRLGGRREGAGRKAKDWAAALEASPEVAWKELSEPLDRLSDLIVRQRRHAVLTPTDLHTLRDAIDLLHEVVHADA